MQRMEQDQPAFWNGFANMASLAGHAVTIERGEGVTVFDTAGRPYLDAIASLWYSNVGHGRAELAEAATAQMARLAAYQTFEPFANPPGPRCSSPRAGDPTPWTPRGSSREPTGARQAGPASR